ncbi:MAG: hypothetical protein QXY62_00200 [Candidatus Altiarchaeota archaeon]
MRIELRYRNIEARRFSFANMPVDINNNSTVVSVLEDEGNLKVDFVFTSNYEPNVGLIRIEGELIVNDTKENIKKVIEEWKKSNNKNLLENFAEEIHNAILTNCIVEATILSRDVQLPIPIPTPKISIKEKKQKNEERVYIR